MPEEIKITGTIEDIIFHNNDNGYAVFTVETKDDEIVCVGYVPSLHTGESIDILGNWTMHPTYGKQLQISYFEKTVPTTLEGMEKYLASGVIKGIGAKTAKKIVDRFGEATFYIIEEKPDGLVEIKGINFEKAMTINKTFVEQNGLRRAMLFLQDFGITPSYAMKIFKKYKEKTYEIVKTNPYKLADDIFGIGFKMADKLATSSGIAPDSPFRVKAAIKYALTQASSNGHVYLPKIELMTQVSEMINIPSEIIENSIVELQLNHQVWQDTINDEPVVYLNVFYYSEISVAKKLIELSMLYSPNNYIDIEKIIDKCENKNGIKLAPKQREAVMEAMTNGVLVITGGPGTGKTTTINTIIQLLKEDEQEIVLAAPTGRAAKRMTEATGMDAQTIHRLLGISFMGEDGRGQTFDKNQDNPIDADVVIIDESSMVDISLMTSLLNAIMPGTRLILVGDVDQLPSVGAGNVLKDIIKSKKIPVVRLNEIFRQAQESAIVMNAHRINNGESPILNEKDSDFFFVRRSYVEDAVAAIGELITKRLPSFLDCDGFSNIQVLTPMRKSPLGVQNLNNMLQNVLNPASKGKNEKEFRGIVFREGDKVMQIKNNYNLAWKIYNSHGKRTDEGIGVFNGDQGIIESIDIVNELITVSYDDNKLVDYDFTQIDELELAYAITIHKSQGSEYPVVIIPIHSGPPMLMSRNLLYTAVTRAKQFVVIVGISETINKMVQNNKEVNRYTSLNLRLENMYEFLTENQ